MPQDQSLHVANAVRFQNLLLATLCRDDQLLLLPLLVPHGIATKQTVEVSGETLLHVYFVESGIMSVVDPSARRPVEVGLIGHEGLTGLGALLGVERSAFSIFAQSDGTGFKIAVADLQPCIEKSGSLRRHLLKFVHTFNVQIAGTAVANSSGSVESRLARWLLMAQDRLTTTHVTLTHEFLSVMLGVRRAGVTDAMHVLEGRRLIKASRGLIDILDRDGLKSATRGLYGGPEAEYRHVFASA